MVSSCIACCNSNRTKTTSYHRFPFSRPEILKKWILFCRRKNFVPNKYNRICSEHFTDDAFMLRPGAEKRYLKEDAVPSLFGYFRKKTSQFLGPCPNITKEFPGSSSQLIKQEPLDGDFAPRIETVGSTNKILIVPDRPEVTPTFSNYSRNDKTNMIVVSDPTDYKNILNSHSNARRRIVVSDGSKLEKEPGSSLANIYRMETTRADNIIIEPIGLNIYKDDPLILCDDEFLSEKIKELEVVVKALKKEKKNWLAKVRRRKRKFKNLRKEYFKFTMKDQPLLRCNSQPVVHRLTLNV